MSSIWGNRIRVSLFGESHGEAIGCVLDGLPSGVALDLEAIQKDLKRRSASSYQLATPRKEKDQFKILSGFFNGYTTGTPLCAVIENTNTRSKDYSPHLLRPGHADYTAYLRYNGYQDYRGGGHFSGRITAALVIAGSIAKQVLKTYIPDIKIGSRILSVGEITDRKYLDTQTYQNLDLEDLTYPVYSKDLIEQIDEEIRSAMSEQDSLGGVIEGFVINYPAGIGNPFFESIESKLSALLFSVPAVKGVEFGLGFDFKELKGSEANDSFRIDDDQIYTTSNNNGGINGGITNGMPIIFRCVIKPTPSIRKEQETVDYRRKKNITYSITGRHDPCIVLRAPVVIEAVTALGLLDFINT